MRAIFGLTIACGMVVSFCAADALRAQAGSRDALSGKVTFSNTDTMEGVLVSARRAGSTITVTVVSNRDGEYHFPSARVTPGQYTLSVRAVGYELAGSDSVTVGPATKTLNLRLRKTGDVSAQLTDAEWLASVPGSPDQKVMLDDCNACHSLQRVVRAPFTSAEWIPILQRMRSAYATNSESLGLSGPSLAQRRLVPRNIPAQSVKAMADYLASIDLGGGSSWTYPLKTLPRPTGRATRVIVTEYALPGRLTMPHDVIVDHDGLAWYTDFGRQILGELDPKSGTAREYSIPTLKAGSPKGSLDLEMDKAGNLWIGMMLQGGVAEFDPHTKTFKTWSLPPQVNTDASQIAMLTRRRRLTAANSGPTTRVVARFIASTRLPTTGRRSDRCIAGRINSSPTGCTSTRKTTRFSSTTICRGISSERSTREPGKRASLRFRPKMRADDADGSIPKTASGLRNMSGTRSRCSIQKRNCFANGRCRPHSHSRTMSSPTKMAMRGRPACGRTA
jgi:hypothetical protein